MSSLWMSRISFLENMENNIELYPDKSRKEGCAVKMVHFKFPVAYNGEAVYDVLSPLATTDETVCLLRMSIAASRMKQMC